MITLAVATGISAEQWGKEGIRAIATGLEVLAEMNGHKPADEDDDQDQPGRGGPQYSG